MENHVNGTSIIELKCGFGQPLRRRFPLEEFEARKRYSVRTCVDVALIDPFSRSLLLADRQAFPAMPWLVGGGVGSCEPFADAALRHLETDCGFAPAASRLAEVATFRYMISEPAELRFDSSCLTYAIDVPPGEAGHLRMRTAEYRVGSGFKPFGWQALVAEHDGAGETQRQFMTALLIIWKWRFGEP